MEGPYKIDLFAWDYLGNTSYIPNVWNGDIDTIAPQIVLTHTKVSGGIYQISCQASDYNLTDQGWACPSGDAPTYGYNAAPWFQKIFNAPDKLETLVNHDQTGLASGDYHMTACDTVGNCTTATGFISAYFEKDTGINLPGALAGNARWGDYDADGDPDALLTGQSGNSTLSQIWRNTTPLFSFGSGVYTTTESTNSVNLSVVIDSAQTKAVSVTYTTTDGSATAGSDYTAASDTLTFEIDARAPAISVSNLLASSEQDDPLTAAGLVSDTNNVVMRLTILTPNGQFTADRIERMGNTWVYSDTLKFLRTGDYQVWVEAEDAAGNVVIAGAYQVERVLAGVYSVYLPMVARDWDASLAVLHNRVHLPMIVK